MIHVTYTRLVTASDRKPVACEIFVNNGPKTPKYLVNGFNVLRYQFTIGIQCIQFP